MSLSDEDSDPLGIKTQKPELFATRKKDVADKLSITPDDETDASTAKQQDIGLTSVSDLLKPNRVHLKIWEEHQNWIEEKAYIETKKRALSACDEAWSKPDTQKGKYELPEFEAHLPMSMFELEDELKDKNSSRKSLKEKEKSRRQKGQSSIATWKTETEMKMRNEYD